jgi:hypothetical protein
VAGDQRVALCANSSTAAGKVPSTARGRPRAAGAALRPAGQQLAARLSGHCDSAQAGAFSQVGEFGVGVEMAVARNRLGRSRRPAQLRCGRVDGEAGRRGVGRGHSRSAPTGSSKKKKTIDIATALNARPGNGSRSAVASTTRAPAPAAARVRPSPRCDRRRSRWRRSRAHRAAAGRRRSPRRADDRPAQALALRGLRAWRTRARRRPRTRRAREIRPGGRRRGRSAVGGAAGDQAEPSGHPPDGGGCLSRAPRQLPRCLRTKPRPGAAAMMRAAVR